MQFAKYIPVIIASTIKFVGGPLAGLAMGLTWPETALCATIGMMITVILVTYAGTAIQALLQRYRSAPPKRFTRRTRLAVRIFHRTGLAGIAFLTPLILTPIVGAALAVSFRLSRVRIVFYMLLSAIFWAIVQTVLLYQIPGIERLFGR